MRAVPSQRPNPIALSRRSLLGCRCYGGPDASPQNRDVRNGCSGSIIVAPLLLSATAALALWKPPQRLSWYWQLTGNVNNSYPAAAYDIDGFDNSQREVATLHSAKKHVICYVDVGTWENWRPGREQVP